MPNRKRKEHISGKKKFKTKQEGRPCNFYSICMFSVICSWLYCINKLKGIRKHVTNSDYSAPCCIITAYGVAACCGEKEYLTWYWNPKLRPSEGPLCWSLLLLCAWGKKPLKRTYTRNWISAQFFVFLFVFFFGGCMFWIGWLVGLAFYETGFFCLALAILENTLQTRLVLNSQKSDPPTSASHVLVLGLVLGSYCEVKQCATGCDQRGLCCPPWS